MKVTSRRAWAVVAIGLALVACSNGAGESVLPSTAGQYPGWPGSGAIVGSGDFVPIMVSSEVGTGHSRVLIALTDAAGRDLGAQDVTVEERYYDLAGSTEKPVSTADGTFRWLIPDSKTIYTSYADFAHPGDWGVEVTAHQPGKSNRTARVTFSVRDTTTTPAIGAAAPPSDTLTATDPAALVVISTDTDPDPAFYALSVKDAIAAGKPFVLVFATPLFCTSGLCGPALDLVKQVAPDYVGRVNFIHVEPYILQVKDGRTQPELDVTGYPKSVRAAVEWGLPTEPWVFVVDAQGKVAAKFEGMAYPDELTAALDAVLR
ncbi:MAG: TlpA family protein disulfide reductase [Candidatus Limnocylindria bacterium]